MGVPYWLGVEPKGASVCYRRGQRCIISVTPFSTACDVPVSHGVARESRGKQIPPPEMQLKRQHTIKRAGEFAYVRAQGHSRTGRYFVMSTAPFRQEGNDCSSYFGIVTTRRIGRAVVRNRLRRQVRSLLREQGDALGGGSYVVVVVRQGAVGADYDALRREMKKLIAYHGQRAIEET